jgi:hypothetical protein
MSQSRNEISEMPATVRTHGVKPNHRVVPEFWAQPRAEPG